MKKHIIILLTFCIVSICYAQEHIRKDSIKICYGIGGLDHCLTIWIEDDLMFCKRICYSMSNDIGRYISEYSIQSISSHYQEKGIILELDNEKSKEQAAMRYYKENGLQGLEYESFIKQAILRHYKESNNFLILDECVEIRKSQFDELIVIINEIKSFISEGGVRPDGTVIVSTRGRNHYVIKDKSGTNIIVDWLGRYDRCKDIEKVLGLTSYLRCPCVEEDLKKINNNKKPVGRRLFSRSTQ